MSATGYGETFANLSGSNTTVIEVWAGAVDGQPGKTSTIDYRVFARLIPNSTPSV